jgi:hypothetical protein
MADMDAKGRRRPAKGERQGRHRLTEQHVRDIRSARGTASHSAIAKRFGVAKETVSGILSGRTWRHVL